MADEVDMANELAEQALQAALKQARTGNKLVPKGTCYYCEEVLPMEKAANGTMVHRKLFCDVDCSQDYEREERLKSRR